MNTRKVLANGIGAIGVLLGLAMTFGMSVMGSVMADAGTDRIVGPGVDIFLRNRFPGPGGEVVLEIEARGGDRAGLEHAAVWHGDAMLATTEGDGMNWGYSIQKSKTRASDSVVVRFAVPAALRGGDTLPLKIDVGYVVAMSENGSFDNERRHDTVWLDVAVYTPSGRRWAQASLIIRALGLFALWGLVVWGVAAVLGRRPGEAHLPRGDGESVGIGLVLGIMGSGFFGYWLFAWPLMAGLELQSTLWAVLLVAVWLVGPPLWVWRRHKRRQRASTIPTARVV